jgi:hypothetical protein
MAAERLLQHREPAGLRREPSTVRMLAPSACTASVRQARAGAPSICDRAGAAHAVLAADMRAGQAELWRRKSVSSMRGSASPSTRGR